MNIMPATNVYFPVTADLLFNGPAAVHCARMPRGHRRKPVQTAPARKILLDVSETDTTIEILADLPGVAKSDVTIDIDNDTLTLGVTPPTQPVTSGKAAQGDAEPKEQSAELAQAGKQDGRPAEFQKTPEPSAKPEEKAQPKIHGRERSQNFAKRALKLPETADLTQADASLTDGVLRIVVAKKPLPSPKRIRIA